MKFHKKAQVEDGSQSFFQIIFAVILLAFLIYIVATKCAYFQKTAIDDTLNELEERIEFAQDQKSSTSTLITIPDNYYLTFWNQGQSASGNAGIVCKNGCVCACEDSKLEEKKENLNLRESTKCERIRCKQLSSKTTFQAQQTLDTDSSTLKSDGTGVILLPSTTKTQLPLYLEYSSNSIKLCTTSECLALQERYKDCKSTNCGACPGRDLCTAAGCIMLDKCRSCEEIKNTNFVDSLCAVNNDDVNYCHAENRCGIKCLYTGTQCVQCPRNCNFFNGKEGACQKNLCGLQCTYIEGYCVKPGESPPCTDKTCEFCKASECPPFACAVTNEKCYSCEKIFKTLQSNDDYASFCNLLSSSQCSYSLCGIKCKLENNKCVHCVGGICSNSGKKDGCNHLVTPSDCKKEYGCMYVDGICKPVVTSCEGLTCESYNGNELPCKNNPCGLVCEYKDSNCVPRDALPKGPTCAPGYCEFCDTIETCNTVPGCMYIEDNSYDERQCKILVNWCASRRCSYFERHGKDFCESNRCKLKCTYADGIYSGHCLEEGEELINHLIQYGIK